MSKDTFSANENATFQNSSHVSFSLATGFPNENETFQKNISNIAFSLAIEKGAQRTILWSNCLWFCLGQCLKERIEVGAGEGHELLVGRMVSWKDGRGYIWTRKGMRVVKEKRCWRVGWLTQAGTDECYMKRRKSETKFELKQSRFTDNCVGYQFVKNQRSS